MKVTPILLSAALLAGALSLNAKSAKRGVSENQFQYKAQMEAVEPGVTWYYNWGNTAGRYLADQEGIEYVPMCWNGNYNAQNIREFVAAHPSVKYLLGFNEPNFTAQANMTPQAAADLWPAVQQLARDLNLKLVAPALNYSPNPPYQSPTLWMDEFVKLVGNDAFDYVAIHSYGGFGVLKDLATTFHERYGKEVWVTEFCLWPNEGDANSTVLPETQISSMIQTVEWLEKTDWIYRYAWFKAIGESSGSRGPNYGLILSGKGENPRELSEQGKVYVNLPEFDMNAYNAVGSFIPAKNFIAQNGIILGTNNDTATDSPIEITRLNAGASVDYLFDIPEAGEYKVTIRVSGQGEPVRFDPTLGIFAVDGEQETALCDARQFTLPGDNVTYKEETFTVKLNAGRQTIRVRDTAPGAPSGIRVSAIKVGNDDSGVIGVNVDSESAPVDVYNLQGMRLRQGANPVNPLAGLPAGIYIVAGKKVINY